MSKLIGLQFKSKNTFFIFLILSIITFGFAFVIEKNSFDQNRYSDRIRSNIETSLQRENAEINNFLQTTLNNISDKSKSVHLPILLEEYSKRAPEFLTFFVSKNDSILFWSNNQVEYSRSLNGVETNNFIFHKNGWYINYHLKNDTYDIYALYLIKWAYPFENKYLKNAFNPVLNIPGNYTLSKHKTDSEENIISIKNNNQALLFSLRPGDGPNEKAESLSRKLYLISIIIFVIFLISILNHIRRMSWWKISGLISSLILLRVLSIFYKIPSSVYSSQLFSPNYYASSPSLNSLGDLLFNSVLLTFVVLLLYQKWRYAKIADSLKEQKIWLSANVILMLWLTFIFTTVVHYLMATLVLNSSISFNANNIFELSGYSLLGFSIIAMLLFCIYLLCYDVIRLIQKTEFRYFHIVILYFVSLCIFGITYYIFKNRLVFTHFSFAPFLLCNILLLFIFLTRKITLSRISYTRTLTVILIFALFTSYTLNKNISVKERDNRIVLANKLSNEQDLVAEFLFSDVIYQMNKDRFIIKLFDSYANKLQSAESTGRGISKSLHQLYFTGYWNKYEIIINCFDNNDINIPLASDSKKSINEYNNYLPNESQILSNQSIFYFVNDKQTRLSYLGIIPIYNEKGIKTGSLVLEFKTKYLKSSPGFPDLLLTNKIDRSPFKYQYSYASYLNNILRFQNGEYPFLSISNKYELEFNLKPFDQVFKNENDYSHLYYKPTQASLIVVSKPLNDLLDLITPFSYLFTFFSLLFFIFYFLVIAIRSSFKLQLDLKNRIQTATMSIVVISIFVLGGGTIYYIYQSYSNNQNVQVSKQLSNLSQIVESEINIAKINSGNNADNLNSSLRYIAGTNESDFNFYNRKGKLIFSTQPNIFEKNILSSYINPVAFNELEYKSASRYIQFEKAGMLDFLSAYEPIRAANDQIIGYLNYPYFAREDELKREISTFLVALINIYVLLFSIAVIITFFVSNRITKPLKLIQNKLGNIKLGKSNELIIWAKNDEIGMLVKEYNRMVEELSASADLLAKSERETAWREMAKQVAHEIKNPLTPMKLSLQHLQRAFVNKGGDMDDVIQKISKTIIEQIDTLSKIANEFSNFAQMPKAINTQLDLDLVLKNCVQLYKDAIGTHIQYINSTNQSIFVYADKDHMNRVFNNLIKNAIQAIPEEINGKIEIEVKLNGNNKYRISIKDNGLGINPEMIDSIFRPNFTTKSSGTGLGLAMSKNIIESSGGKIWFETEENLGSTFFVELPKLN